MSTMPYRKVEIRAGNYYHLYNRGVNRQSIFFQRENWIFFLQRLRKYFHGDYADLLAYCLMPNHYHLLSYIKHDDFSNVVMQPFSVSYVKAVNKQQARSGPLFEGPYGARHVDRDEYLRYVSSYIHRNPVDAGFVARPEEWQFSSYRDYIGLRNGTLPSKDRVLAQFPSIQVYKLYVESHNPAHARCHAALLFDE